MDSIFIHSDTKFPSIFAIFMYDLYFKLTNLFRLIYLIPLLSRCGLFLLTIIFVRLQIENNSIEY